MSYQPDHMSMSPKGWTFLAFFLMIIIIMVIASACGPTYHLKRAEHHIDKAISKGADIRKDTIRFHFKSPEIKFSTTIRPTWEKHSLSKDTLIAKDEKTGSTVKVKIDQATNCPDSCNRIQTVYIDSNTPPQDQTADVPCPTVQAGYTEWELIGTCIAVAAVFTLVGMFVQAQQKGRSYS